MSVEYALKTFVHPLILIWRTELCGGLINDYKTKIFSHVHSGLLSDGKQISIKSRQIMTKATIFLYHQGQQDM